MLTFATPLFLAALAGLAVPFLIHRISRSRPQVWPFPSIARIRRAPLPRQGRRQLSDWILMALRMLLLSLFILALAGPVWRPPAATGVEDGPQRQPAILLVDASSSMAGWQAGEQARAVIRELQARPDLDWGWVIVSDRIEAEAAPAGRQTALDDLLSALDASAPARVAGRPAAGIDRALALLEGQAAPRHLHLLSDFQSTDWSNPLTEIPADIQVELHPVGTIGRDRNLAIREVFPVPAEGGRLRIIGRLMNFGPEAVPATVVLEGPGQSHRQEISLESGRLTPVAFEVSPFSESPEARLRLDAPADGYDRDDLVPFQAAAPPPLDVLALNLGAGSLEGSEETFFLGQALDTGSDREWQTYSVLPVGLDPLNPETLSRTAAVFVPSSSAGHPDVPWEGLKAYAESGGLLMLTLGDDAVRVLQALRQAGFSIASYQGLAGRLPSDRFHMGPLPADSPLAAVFAGPAARDLFLLSLRRFARLSATGEETVLLQSESADPLLLSLPVGQGRLVLSAFPWDRSASDFPLRSSFLPVVREIFSGQVAPDASTTSVRHSPDVPLSESDPTTLDPAGLLNRLQPAMALAPGLAGDSPSAEPGPASTGFFLAPWLLIAALLIWIIESLLAARLIAQS